ncbi:hypothetical protein BJY04DRAFT_40468 [Aspergillus karnatakaensis]|uniref:putative nucleoside-diphosphate-sugar epimerases n=1 Tax=Aspergillus karnatakaensis TaxID=1810916 RepID=UPI003CCCCE29
MRLILTGATGLVGSATLNHILSLPAGEISALYILSRSPVPMADGKPNVTVIEHKNFNEYPAELLEKLRGADGCIWAQGISQAEVAKEEYIKITVDYPLAAAEAFATLSDSFNFVYVSGEGATQSPKFYTPLFGRTKGQTESALIALSKKYPSLKPYSVRPAYVDPFNDPNVLKQILSRPDQQTFMKKTLHATAGRLMRNVITGQHSPTEYLGKFLTDVAKGNGKPFTGEGVYEGGWIISNAALRKAVGLDS